MNVSAPPLQIAVVGHTNAGKTSLLRTLTRRVDFGEVSDRPGTTRHVEAIDLRIEGRAAVRFFDTPGLEDAVALLQHIAALEADSRPARVRRFLEGPEAHGVFEQEAKVLRKMLEVDAAFLVIDTREPALPKFRDEVELLNSCARPVLPVLNFIRDPASREADWRALLSAGGLHAVVRFDAAAPFTGAERDLYQDLGTLLPEQRAPLREVIDFLGTEFEARRRAACTVIAELLVDGAAMRREIAAAEFAQPAARQAQVTQLQRALFDRAQAAVDELLQLYGFREGDTDEAPLPALQGRWDLDLFDAETLKQAGLRLGQGAAVGAAVGVVADLAVAGLSLGAGAALGGAIGGALAQGFGPLGRKLANRVRGMHELAVEDAVLFVLARWQLALLQALEQRGHAAQQRIATDAAALRAHDADTTAAIVRALRPARSHADWDRSTASGLWRRGESAERRTLVAAVAQRVHEAAARSAG